jgi:CheY-like chemotaxis protein
MIRVLVVDDDEVFRTVLSKILTSLGYEVVETRNAAEAIGTMPTKKIDLVITDLLMPEKDGFELIRFLRRHAPTVPVIVMSGGGKVGPAIYLDMAEQLGADYALVKPFSKNDLQNAIANAMEHRTPE